jgi:hypothetical protein
LITYVTEKFGIWYLSVWWKNRQDRKKIREREEEIAEEERLIKAEEGKRISETKGQLKNSKGGE